TVGPPKAFTPKYSSRHSSTVTPAASARARTYATAARAFASASRQVYVTRHSPAQPAGVHTRPLYVSGAGRHRVPLTGTRSWPSSGRVSEVHSAGIGGLRQR